jgi:uncharacterized membrane protein
MIPNLEIPDAWRVTWNNLGLEEKEFTSIESLFCATHNDLVIWVDYGQRDGIGAYSFTLQNSIQDEPIEQTSNLNRKDALAKLKHWLHAALKLQTFTPASIYPRPKVRVTAVPPNLPAENQTLFEECVGKTFDLIEQRGEMLELWVGQVMGVAPHLHSIWIETTYTDQNLIELRLSAKMLIFTIESLELQIAQNTQSMIGGKLSEDDLADISNDTALLRVILEYMKQKLEAHKNA